VRLNLFPKPERHSFTMVASSLWEVISVPFCLLSRPEFEPGLLLV
jgi:hypothetical protein